MNDKLYKNNCDAQNYNETGYNLNNRNDNLIINLDDNQYSSPKQSQINSPQSSYFDNNLKNKNHDDKNINDDELYARKLQQQEYESAQSKIF